MVVRGTTFETAGFGLELIGRLPNMKERKFPNVDIALLGEANWQRRLTEESLVRQILAYSGHAADAVVPLEVVFNLGCRTRFAHIAQVFHHRAKHQLGAAPHAALDT